MNTKRLFRDIIKVFCIAVLASCGGHRASLREVEALLETNPKAADSILASIPAPHSRQDRAWYTVLKTQADYKQYKALTTDSLILSATNFYGTHRKNYRAAMAWYSQGCVYNELHDDASAIESFLKAQDLFPDTLIRYYALTQQKIGDILLKRDMLKKASDMFKRSKAISELLNDSILIIYSDFKQSLFYLYDSDYEAASVLFQELIESPYLSSYNRLKMYHGMSQIATFYEKDYNKSNLWTDYCISSKSHHSIGYNQRGINYMYFKIKQIPR